MAINRMARRGNGTNTSSLASRIKEISRKLKQASPQEEEEVTEEEMEEASQELEERGLSRTPTVYEEKSDIDEISDSIKLREETSVPILEALSNKQADVYARSIFDALRSGNSIFDVQVPMVKEMTDAYTNEIVGALADGKSQILRQLGVQSKRDQLASAPNTRHLAHLLAKVYVEKRAADTRFEVLKGTIMASADIITAEGQG